MFCVILWGFNFAWGRPYIRSHEDQCDTTVAPGTEVDISQSFGESVLVRGD